MNSDYLFWVAQELGVKILLRSDIAESYFTKGVIHVPITLRGFLHDKHKFDSIQTLAHELGHFIVAPAGRKYKRDYGIIPKGSSRNNIHWDLDEYKAAVVENELMRKIGLKHYVNPLSSIGNISGYMARKLRPVVSKWWEQNKDSILEI